jgi:hypothetical protein
MSLTTCTSPIELQMIFCIGYMTYSRMVLPMELCQQIFFFIWHALSICNIIGYNITDIMTDKLGIINDKFFDKQ